MNFIYSNLKSIIFLWNITFSLIILQLKTKVLNDHCFKKIFSEYVAIHDQLNVSIKSLILLHL